jgi:hypothetical protein
MEIDKQPGLDVIMFVWQILFVTPEINLSPQANFHILFLLFEINLSTLSNFP